MKTKSNDSPPSNKPIDDGFKKEVKQAQKIMWLGFSLVAIILLFVATAVILLTSDSGSIKKTDTEKTVVNALKFKLDNPSSLKVLNISDPDSVFFNRICPEQETMEIAERFLRYSINLMQDSKDRNLKEGNDAYLCSMDRYSESSNAINKISNMLENPQGEHCGWRVKVKYQAVDKSNTPFISEAWFIFDKEQKHILNSFDITIL